MCAWIALAAAAGAATTASAQIWNAKRIDEWTPEEARQVLTESPWAKTVTPTPNAASKPARTRVSPGGIGMGGASLGFPGMGRRGGMGGSAPASGDAANPDSGPLPTLTLRWISALPMSSAQLIAHEMNAPAADADHYAIAVYGLPNGIVHGDPNTLAAELKNHAAIKREGKKDMTPSSVEVQPRDEGPVVVYSFPRGNEITRKDHKVEFDAEIGRLKLSGSFALDDMVYQGKIEL
jgi:hypothetical protein